MNSRLTSETELRLHLTMARQYWLEDRLDLAFAAVRRALEVGVPVGDWYDFQRTVEAEWAARRDGELARIVEHLILEANRHQWGGGWETVCRTATDAQQEVESQLSVRWAKPLLLTLIPQEDWVAFMHARFGYYAERMEWHKVCLPPSAVQHVPVYRAAARHEMAHAAVHQLGGDAVPRWLDEGIAVLLEGGPRPEESRILQVSATNRTLPTLRQISATFESYGVSVGSIESRLCYAAAASFTRSLVDQYGWPAIRDLLRRIGARAAAAAAFRAAIGIDLGRAEREWRSELLRNG